MKKIESKEKRVCIFSGCTTVLNSLNPSVACHLHEKELLNLKVAIKAGEGGKAEGIIGWKMGLDDLQEEGFEFIEIGLACEYVDVLNKVANLMDEENERERGIYDSMFLLSIIPTLIVNAMIKLGYKK